MAPDMAVDAPPGGRILGMPSLRLLVLLAVAFYVASLVGDVLTAAWFDTHPGWLVALNARNRILVLVTQDLGLVAFFAVATARLLAPDVVYYELGRRHGEHAIRWLEQRSETSGRLLRTAERWFARIGAPLIFIAPNGVFVTLAGAAGMTPLTFYLLNITGTLTRVAGIWILGRVYSRQLSRLLDLLDTYRGWVVAASALIVAGSLLRDWRARRRQRQGVTR